MDREENLSPETEEEKENEAEVTEAETEEEATEAETPGTEGGDAQAEDVGEAEAAEEAKEKKGFFARKKDKKDRQIDELNTKVEELTDRVKRSMAEFDNYRKRTDKEKAAMFDMGSRSVIEKMLPVVDNFERGLATIPEEQKGDAFVTGMEKTYQQLMKTLEDLGVEPIKAVGETFDPNFHNAVMHVEDENAGENTVVEEFQKGYLHKGSVVRYSMVKVAN